MIPAKTPMPEILKENRQMTILLVDDKDENLVSLEEMLTDENRVFLKATSGNEALKLALKNDNIGLILLDVQMPGMDGFEVAQLLKSNARTRDISIIFVTALGKEERYTLKGFDSGAVDYLNKPLDVNITKAKVRVFEQLYFSRQQLEAAIEQKNRINQQLERFTYTVAHDIKSPLSGLSSMLDIIKEDDRVMQYADLNRFVTLMANASIYLGEMVSSLLEYSRKSNMDLHDEEVDVHEMVLQIAHLLFPPPHVTITVEGHLPVINTKRFKLQQVFQNLISNAVKYLDKTEGIITVGCIDDDPEFYRFYVKDNGPGIEEKDQARIFKLYETTTNKANTDSSTGFGLNIVKLTVEEQGGTLSVESRPGEGSCFYFQWAK